MKYYLDGREWAGPDRGGQGPVYSYELCFDASDCTRTVTALMHCVDSMAQEIVTALIHGGT